MSSTAGTAEAVPAPTEAAVKESEPQASPHPEGIPPDDPDVLLPPPTVQTNAVNLLRLAKTRTDLEDHHTVRLSTLPDSADLHPPKTAPPAARHTAEWLALALLRPGLRPS